MVCTLKPKCECLPLLHPLRQLHNLTSHKQPLLLHTVLDIWLTSAPGSDHLSVLLHFPSKLCYWQQSTFPFHLSPFPSLPLQNAPTLVKVLFSFQTKENQITKPEVKNHGLITKDRQRMGEKTESQSNFPRDSNGDRKRKQVSWECIRLQPPGLSWLWQHPVFLAWPWSWAAAAAAAVLFQQQLCSRQGGTVSTETSLAAGQHWALASLWRMEEMLGLGHKGHRESIIRRVT